jgi:hypothetical protein
MRLAEQAARGAYPRYKPLALKTGRIVPGPVFALVNAAFLAASVMFSAREFLRGH